MMGESLPKVIDVFLMQEALKRAHFTSTCCIPSAICLAVFHTHFLPCRYQTPGRSDKEHSLFKDYCTIVPSNPCGFQPCTTATGMQKDEQGAKKRS